VEEGRQCRSRVAASFKTRGQFKWPRFGAERELGVVPVVCCPTVWSGVVWCDGVCEMEVGVSSACLVGVRACRVERRSRGLVAVSVAVSVAGASGEEENRGAGRMLPRSRFEKPRRSVRPIGKSRAAKSARQGPYLRSCWARLALRCVVVRRGARGESRTEIFDCVLRRGACEGRGGRVGARKSRRTCKLAGLHRCPLKIAAPPQ
jgi:hypothetical protein